MECVANYEIKSECSVVQDERVLRIQHPKGLYRARIQNIPRTAYTTPFLLSLHLYFNAPSLNEAKDVADGLLVDCLNMFAFTTGSLFQRHRIRQIVDATPGAGMREILMWSDSIEYQDPQPFLTDETTQAIERLSEFDLPPSIRRAMKWYRLGVNSTVPDDQFMYFWFAVEIVAEFQKSPERVPDRCPKCRSPLYCEPCKTHPEHRPFAKQAIRDLLKSVDKGCDDAVVDMLEMARNSLMHGKTLKEIEDSLPNPHEQIVDVLGRLLWKVLVHQFPREMFDGKLSFGSPSTYVHRKLNAVAHVKTIVPVDASGDFDLRFTGTKAELVPFGPPQSAKPTIIKVSPSQFERIGKLRYAKGDHQEMCRRIYERTKTTADGRVYAAVLSTDMGVIQAALKRNEVGDWQDLFREVFEQQSQRGG